MTSTGNQNPSLTYMALTARAADYAATQFKAGNLYTSVCILFGEIVRLTSISKADLHTGKALTEYSTCRDLQ